MVMNIALVFPRLHSKSGDPPLGLGYLASNVPGERRRDVKIVDGTFLRSIDDLYMRLSAVRYDIVGIYFDTMSYGTGIKIAQWLRQSGVFVIAGGPHATILPETLLEYVDVVVLGEGERTFAEILQKKESLDLSDVKGIIYKKNGEVVQNPPREPIDDLDSVCFPERHLLDMNNYMAAWHYLDILDMGIKGTTVVASRGCPFSCTYCQPTLFKIFGKRPRMRGARNIIEEIKELKKNYDIKGIFFHDDTLTANKSWLNELCDRLIMDSMDILWACNARADMQDDDMFRKMHRAGLRYMHVGVESGNQRILDEIYRKKIRLDDIEKTIACAKKAGIRAGCFFMLGAPTETRDELKQTIRFASSLDIDEATFNITTPLPGTFLYEMVKNLNYRISGDYSDFNYYSRRAFEDPNLSNRVLNYYQKKALFGFYLRPRRWRYVLRHFTSPQGFKKLIIKVRRFFK
jgi:anaerobic magnesium-protoporphyrin IX monomethyl ester cyclase